MSPYSCILLMFVSATIVCDSTSQGYNGYLPTFTSTFMAAAATQEFQNSYNRVYKVFDTRLSWYEAEIICIDLRGHLPVIKSDAERVIILERAESLLKNSPIWLGYSEHDMPNRGSQDCPTLWSLGAVDDENCNKMLPFVCKVSII